MALYVNALIVDCTDPIAVARFWSEALNWPIVDQNEEEVLVAPSRERSDVPGVHPILFGRNQDAKTVKNRWHLDLAPDDQETEVTRLEGLGAKRIDIGQGDVSWVVMADPEGNEFCVLRSLRASGDEGA